MMPNNLPVLLLVVCRTGPVGVTGRRNITLLSAPPGARGRPNLPGRSAHDPPVEDAAPGPSEEVVSLPLADSASLQREHNGVMWPADSSWTCIG